MATIETAALDRQPLHCVFGLGKHLLEPGIVGEGKRLQLEGRRGKLDGVVDHVLVFLGPLAVAAREQLVIEEVADDVVQQIQQGPIGCFLVRELGLVGCSEGEEPVLLVGLLVGAFEEDLEFDLDGDRLIDVGEFA